jgi:hypothetical protein
MATKKAPPAKSKPAPAAKSVLQNLAARPPNVDDTLDEQMVDSSGVFRVTAAIQQAQTGHDEEQGMRFANDSLVMAAQRDNFREAPSEDTIDENLVDDESAAAVKRQRLATLAARNAALARRRR